MGGYQRTSTLRLFDLLFLASAASAVSLSSFKLISSNGLPLACVIAYNTPISGCTNNDFTTGNTCSSTCIEGIETTEALINSACDQVDPGDNTILILAMNGRLVDALCPNNGGGGNNGGNGDDDDDNKTKTTARVTTSSARSTTTSVGRFTTIPSSSTRSTSSTSSSPLAADPAQSESTTKSTSSISKSTTLATSVPVTTGDVLTVTSTASPSRSTTATSAEAAKETDPLDNGGGGSPFDESDSFASQFSAANPGYQVKWWPATLAAVFAAAWVLAH